MTGLFKKISIILFILIIFIVSIASISAQDDNNDTNNDTFLEDVNVKTYTDLQENINATKDGAELELNESYRYNSTADGESFIDGVKISKNITIIGKNNTFIDGNFLARGFNITSNCTVVLKNIIFKNGYSTTGGSAILVNHFDNLVVDNCTFHSNYVYNSNGGAIYCLESSNVDIYRSEFYNNTATRVSNLPWGEYKKGMGSVICTRIGTNLKLIDSIIRDNIGYLTTILVITWDDVNTNQSTIYVDNCIFENNVARSNTVIYLDEFGIGEILNSIFKNNVATYSGGILTLDTSKSAIVKNCTFEGNSAIKTGAISVNSYDSAYRSNATIVDCTFTNNTAADYGGAISSIYGITEVKNCVFNSNVAIKNGGAIYAKIGKIDIENCKFNKNSAVYGGALLLKADSNVVKSSSFVSNVASVAGGAIYASSGTSSSSGCTFSKNSAPKASKVYGEFDVAVTKYVAASGYTKLKIIISSPWKMSLSQKIKVKINGYTSGWLKTNSNGKYVFTVPKGKSVAKKTLSITLQNEGYCVIKSYVYKNPGKITVPKSVKKSSKLKVTIKNSQTKLPIKKTQFTVKIYTGKKYKTYKMKTNDNGIFKISMKKFSRGNHKINVYLSTNSYYINKKISFRIR